MSNTVPDGWEYRQLGDYIIDSAAGEWGNEAQGDDNDIPVLRSTNFTKSGVIDYTKLAFRNIEKRKRIKKALKNGDILLEKSGGSPTQPVGRVVYFDRDTPHLYSNFTQKLVPAETCHSKYLFYKLYFEYQNGTVLKFQQQTTGIINFQLAEYLGFKTTFAPLPEQQKIAAILSSVDGVIEKTRAQIDKLKDLKTAMMQKLLTKGIGHTEFKDSPVGRIPADWRNSSLKELCAVITKGTTPTTYGNSYTETGINFIKVESINRDGILDSSKFSFIDEETHQKLSRSKLEEGDILVTIAGATIGKLAIVRREHLPANTNQALAVVRTDESKVLRDFVFYWLQSSFIKNSISNIQTVGAQPNLSLAQIGNFPIALPDIKEQQKIVCSLSEVDGLTALKRRKFVAAKLVKKALMQDLLTGKVRVKVDHKESAVA